VHDTFGYFCRNVLTFVSEINQDLCKGDKFYRISKPVEELPDGCFFGCRKVVHSIIKTIVNVMKSLVI
jgi:hypothetical protein